MIIFRGAKVGKISVSIKTKAYFIFFHCCENIIFVVINDTEKMKRLVIFDLDGPLRNVVILCTT